MNDDFDRTSKMHDNEVISFIDERIERLEEIAELMESDVNHAPEIKTHIRFKCLHRLHIKIKRLFNY